MEFEELQPPACLCSPSEEAPGSPNGDIVGFNAAHSSPTSSNCHTKDLGRRVNRDVRAKERETEEMPCIHLCAE